MTKKKNEIPNALGKKTVFFKNGNTNDIIKVMMIGEQRFESYGKEFCKWATANFKPTKEGLEKLWKMVNGEITYKVDPNGEQLIKTPPALASIGEGDCKSKTLFVNAVLRCLGVPYKTRFVSYDSLDQRVSHVYTIAFLNGKRIVMDTVYKYFNREVFWYYKQDFNMTEISLIEGLPEDNRNTELQTIDSKVLCASGTLTQAEEIYYKAKELSVKKLEEIRQKKKYIPQFENVNLNQVSEGTASLKLIERELSIIKTMKPELAEQCEKGLSMVRKAIEGNYCITGDVDDYLYRYAAKIQDARTKVRPANSYGLATKAINSLKKVAGVKCQHRSAAIGATFPRRECFNGVWAEEKPNIPFAYYPIATSTQNGFCANSTFQVGSIYNLLGLPNNAPLQMSGSMPTATVADVKSRLYYGYGSNTPFRIGFNSFGQGAKNTIEQLITDGVISGPWDGSYWFNTQQDLDLTLETLNQNSGVTSNWLNQSFATNPSDTGTLGSAMFYAFADQISNTGISGMVPMNDLPTQVQIKKSIEDTYLNSCSYFSGASLSMCRQLSRNGILFDSGGEQPELMLGKLWRLSNSNTGISGHAIGDFGISATIIAAIAAAIVTITAAVGNAVAKANAAAVNSNSIDSSLSASSQFRPPNLNQSPNGSDWPLKQTSGSGNNNSGSSSKLPLFLGAGVLGYMALSDDS